MSQVFHSTQGGGNKKDPQITLRVLLKKSVLGVYFSLAYATTMRRWGSMPVEKVVT